MVMGRQLIVCRTLDSDVKGSILTGAVLCPLPLIVLRLIHKKAVDCPGMTSELLTDKFNKQIKLTK